MKSENLRLTALPGKDRVYKKRKKVTKPTLPITVKYDVRRLCALLRFFKHKNIPTRKATQIIYNSLDTLFRVVEKQYPEFLENDPKKALHELQRDLLSVREMFSAEELARDIENMIEDDLPLSILKLKERYKKEE